MKLRFLFWPMSWAYGIRRFHGWTCLNIGPFEIRLYRGGMKSFRNHNRIRVTGPGPIKGKTGTVVRLRHGDNGAWVKMDEDLPGELISFPDPHDDRHRHVMLYPDECEAL